jgi:hypothetical protein
LATAAVVALNKGTLLADLDTLCAQPRGML